MRSLTCGFALAFSLLFAPWAAAADDLPAAGKAVSIEVIIADVFPTAVGSDTPTLEQILDLEKQGKLASLTRLRMATIDLQKAMVQFGERVPVATGRMVRGGGPPGGGESFAYTTMEMGTTIEATPRVEDDGSVILLLSLQDARLKEVEKPEGASFAPAKTAQLVSRTTLRIPPGKAVITGGQRSDKEKSQVWIAVSAKVIEAK